MTKITPPIYSTLLNESCMVTGDTIMLESWLSVIQVQSLYTNAMLAMRRLRQEMANSVQGARLLEELEDELRTAPSSWIYWLGSSEVQSGGHLAPRKDVDPHYLMTVLEVYRVTVASFIDRSSWHKNQCRKSYEDLNKAYNSLANSVPYFQMKSMEEDPQEKIPFDWPNVT